MNDTSESTFSLPPELQDVPTNYSMSHITYEDVNGILSLVEIALARGSIKGDELAILNQIRNDCLLEVQDYQSWVQKRQQIVAVEQQIANEQAKVKQQQEIESVKATSDAKVQSAQEASRILQNRIVELENQIKARNITPVSSATPDAELENAMDVPPAPTTTSKAFENARANNPVPTISNQPSAVDDAADVMSGMYMHPQPSPSEIMQDELEPIYTPQDNPDQVEMDLSDEESISDAMQKTWETLEQEDWDEERMDRIGQNGNDGEHYDNVEPLFEIKVGQDGNAPLGQQVSEDDVNMNVTEMDDFEHLHGDGEVEIEVSEDPESIAEVQAMKEAVQDEYEEVVIPNSMELQKMTKAKIKEVADSIGITVSDNQTKSAMIKDFEEESWNLIQEAEQDENATVHTDEDIIRDGGYFGEDDSK